MRDPKPDPMRELMGIMTRLSQRAAEPRPAKQKVTQTVLSDIVEAVVGSIQMLTGRAGVSEASITRFVRAMNCRDVCELRLKLAQVAAIGQRFLDGGADRPPSSADDILADISNVLEVSRALVQPEAFCAAVVALVAAHMVAMLDMDGNSTTMADEMCYRLARLGRLVVTYHGPVLQQVVAATLNPDGMMVVFSVIGYVPEVIDGVTIVREYGARIVTITTIGPPLAALADVSLPVQVMETDLIFKPSSSRYAMMMMTDLLATEVVLQQTDRSKKLLRCIKYVLNAHHGGDNHQPLGD